ncbi:HAD-superfamily hydrolase, subfamily IA, variant 1 [Hydrogenobaculum sp. Y04AAS1]|uniref:HAD-IA family hydrolase n=1 Tax=Hydrogenobaculum sp. (strain Y04AAS1) TaxID=380749 RepID=UPI00015BC6BF|nr:HAD-superfamily hydrolase, subfamily IA, variant 1 [Hydrogenobaculum sp. Y04AAS1]HCT66064.1 HAD family hydrolase [Hydrogenobaculum sp.]
MHFEGYIFDLDGTLIDSLEDIANAANKTLKDLGFEEKSKEEIKKHIGSGTRELFKGILEDKTYLEKAIEVFKSYYAQEPIKNTKLFEGASEVLKLLKSKNKKMAVVSNKPLELSNIILKALNIENYFEYIVGPETYNERKPSPVPIARTLEKMCINPGESIVIGDTYVDIESAKKSNCKSALASWGYVKLKETKPDFVLKSFEDLVYMI